MSAHLISSYSNLLLTRSNLNTKYKTLRPKGKQRIKNTILTTQSPSSLEFTRVPCPTQVGSPSTISNIDLRLIANSRKEYTLFPTDWQFFHEEIAPAPPFPACQYFTPSFFSRPKRDNHHTWAAFSIDTQGKIPYTSIHKKGVLIILMTSFTVYG